MVQFRALFNGISQSVRSRLPVRGAAVTFRDAAGQQPGSVRAAPSATNIPSPLARSLISRTVVATPPPLKRTAQCDLSGLHERGKAPNATAAAVETVPSTALAETQVKVADVLHRMLSEQDQDWHGNLNCALQELAHHLTRLGHVSLEAKAAFLRPLLNALCDRMSEEQWRTLDLRGLGLEIPTGQGLLARLSQFWRGTETPGRHVQVEDKAADECLEIIYECLCRQRTESMLKATVKVDESVGQLLVRFDQPETQEHQDLQKLPADARRAVKEAFQNIHEMGLLEPLNRHDLTPAVADKDAREELEKAYNRYHALVQKSWQKSTGLALLPPISNDPLAAEYLEPELQPRPSPILDSHISAAYKAEKWITATCIEHTGLMFQACVDAGLPPSQLWALHVVGPNSAGVYFDHLVLVYEPSRERSDAPPGLWVLDPWAPTKFEFVGNDPLKHGLEALRAVSPDVHALTQNTKLEPMAASSG